MDDEFSAVFVFSKKTGFLKSILPNAKTHEETKMIEDAIKRLVKPETGNWISRIFKK